jgi:hypothetical protein
VRVNEDAAEARDTKALDEAHAPHVRGEVVDLGRTLAEASAVGFLRSIETQALGVWNALVPFLDGLFVGAADAGEAAAAEVPREGAANEAAGAGDDYEIVFPELWSFFDRTLLFHFLISVYHW